MQVLDETKRERILKAASELFSTLPFHEVRLSDVAARAEVGKGTLYCYYESKEALFAAVSYAGLGGLLEELKDRLDISGTSAREALKHAVRELVLFASRNPRLYDLVRSQQPLGKSSPDWNRKRRELTKILETILRRGIAEGAFRDSNPHLTAVMIPGMVRSVILFASEVEPDALAAHIDQLLVRALDGVPEK